MIRFRLPNGEIDSFPPEARETLRRVCAHEVGHAEVAIHFGVRVHGVALSQVIGGVEAAAFYETRIEMPPKDWCTIKAAGPAGEVVAFGSYSPTGARRDLEDIRSSGYLEDFDALVREATSILFLRKVRFEGLTRKLCNRIFESDEVLTMNRLKLGRIGAYLLDEADLARGS